MEKSFCPDSLLPDSFSGNGRTGVIRSLAAEEAAPASNAASVPTSDPASSPTSDQASKAASESGASRNMLMKWSSGGGVRRLALLLCLHFRLSAGKCSLLLL